MSPATVTASSCVWWSPDREHGAELMEAGALDARRERLLVGARRQRFVLVHHGGAVEGQPKVAGGRLRRRHVHGDIRRVASANTGRDGQSGEDRRRLDRAWLAVRRTRRGRRAAASASPHRRSCPSRRSAARRRRSRRLTAPASRPDARRPRYPSPRSGVRTSGRRWRSRVAGLARTRLRSTACPFGSASIACATQDRSHACC